MENINVNLIALPNTVKAYVVANADQSYTIVLNSNLNHEQQMQSYEHEMEHISNGDYDKDCTADQIEQDAHSA